MGAMLLMTPDGCLTHDTGWIFSPWLLSAVSVVHDTDFFLLVYFVLYHCNVYLTTLMCT